MKENYFGALSNNKCGECLMASHQVTITLSDQHIRWPALQVASHFNYSAHVWMFESDFSRAINKVMNNQLEWTLFHLENKCGHTSTHYLCHSLQNQEIHQIILTSFLKICFSNQWLIYWDNIHAKVYARSLYIYYFIDSLYWVMKYLFHLSISPFFGCFFHK